MGRNRTASHHGFICIYRGGGHLATVVIYGEAIWIRRTDG